jgi:hypothetical protein
VTPPAPKAIAASPLTAHAQPGATSLAELGSGSPGRLAYVQVASLDSQQAAEAEWQRLQAKLPELLGSHTPEIAQAEVDGRTYWRLRTDGFATLAEASGFCERLRAGGAGCWAVLAGPTVE